MKTETFSLLNLYQAVHYLYISGEHIQEVTIHEPLSKPNAIPEALIHHIWKHQLLSHSPLQTVQGQRLQILDAGVHNTHGSGADFFMARIQLDDMEWIGDVEIHVRSSDWTAHRHDRDPSYNRVVLHVALFEDAQTGKLKIAQNQIVPEFILAPHLTEGLRHLLYQFHTHPDQDFLCQTQWKSVPNALLESFITALGYERIHEKAQKWHGNHGFQQLLYEYVMMALGYSQNRNVMLALAQKVPISWLHELRSLKDREALLLGAAGLLPSSADMLEADRETADVVHDWLARFERLRHHYDLVPLTAHQWHFSGLRPANFPTLRLAQAASLFNQNGLFDGDAADNLLHAIHEPKTLRLLRSLLQTSPSDFWNTHFRLTATSKTPSANMGAERCNIIIINAILPALLHLADYEEMPHLRLIAFDLLKQLPKSDDHITRAFAHPNWKPRHAADYQGLHQLFRTRCAMQECLSCEIGKWMMNE